MKWIRNQGRRKVVQAQNIGRPLVKVTLLLASALVPLGGATLAPALPAISAAFGGSANADFLTRMVLTVPALFIALSAPFAGYVVDNFGRKRVLVVSLTVVGLAGMSCFMAFSLGFLLVGRMIVGIGVAGIMVSATTLIADYYSGDERSRLMGLQAAMMGLAGTFLFITIGYLADISWQTAFLVYVLPLATLPLVLVVLHEPHQEFRCAENPPPTGEPGTCVGESIAAIGESAMGSATDEPVPFKLIAFIYSVILLAQIAFVVVPVHLPFYMQEQTGASATQSGIAIASMTLAFAAASVFYGRFLSRQDHITVLMIAFALFGAGYALISVGGGPAAMYLGLIVSGIGMGLVVPNLYVWLANETPLAIRGRALGGFTTALFLGQFLSPIISHPIRLASSIEITILIVGVVLLVFVPLIFVSRRQLSLLGTIH
jgi:MFS family permease